MSITHYTMKLRIEQYGPARAKILAERDAWRATPEWHTANLVQRSQAEKLFEEKLSTLDAAFLAAQKETVTAAETAYKAHAPTTVQRRAAVDDPARAAAIRELARGCSPADLKAMADELVRTGDAAGAFGLRQAVASLDLPGDDVGPVVSRALEAGTFAAKAKLIELVRARVAWAQSVGVISGLTDPASVLSAVYEARDIPQADGSTRRFSETELEQLVADE